MDDVFYAPNAEQQQKMEEYICGLMADALRISKTMVLLNVRRNAPLIELGFDSLMAVQVKNRLLKEHRLDISLIDFFEEKSISEIAKLLAERLTGPGPQGCQNEPEQEWEEGEI